MPFAGARAAERLSAIGTRRTVFRIAAAFAISARTARIAAGGTGFVISESACRTARALADRAVVFREVRIVRRTPGSVFAGGVIGITPGTGATFDPFGGRRPLALVACETVI